MAEVGTNIKVISKKNSGFPEYLDFNKLRSDSIKYLGELSGNIWTDHNVHDPGITILEALIYAVLDLGYRTNLPKEEIFARPPEENGPDSDFYTPARILACNPLTITDYRKLLIDIDGIKNAWLSVATDVKVGAADPIKNNRPKGSDTCDEYINGLYTVHLEIDSRFPNDEEQQEEFEECIVKKAKNALMCHRNLCEDFVRIYVLKKFSVGVLGDIELESTADAEKIYVQLVKNVRDFLAPAPRFYTLPQLLDKGKTIEEIFAGRPYNITESHGFVDTEEFEALEHRQEIHVSDIYKVILNIPGVRSVRTLRLRDCGTGSTADWVSKLPDNTVPELSVPCCDFRFTKNDSPVSVDVQKFKSFFNFTADGKTLYTVPSPYLDAEIKYGNYHKDISEYLSVQNDFPQVYGIGPGELLTDVSPERKAQALQLKGYLLFFDQLLANYLAQLSNIRNLFSFSLNTKEARHTYFANKLSTVPELDKLLRFNANGDAVNGDGSILAYPVSRHILDEKIKNNEILKADIEKDFAGYVFRTAAECDTATSQMIADLEMDDYQPVVISNSNECCFFYLLTSSGDVALISKKYYPDKKSAAEAAGLIRYLAGIKANYRRYIVPATNEFSFDLNFNLSGYLPNLQAIIEPEGQFLTRRDAFLDHLLARFSERFTDYALLSYNFLSPDDLQTSDIGNKETFLANYADLSSNRGIAYNYKTNGWNNDNVSGFEKKFKALAGIEHWGRTSLCNFESYRYDEQYTADLTIAGKKYFSIPANFKSQAQATEAASLVFNSLGDREKYRIEPVPHEQAFAIKIAYQEDEDAVFPGKYYSEEEANTISDNLHRVFAGKASSANTYVSGYVFKPQLKDFTGDAIRTSVDQFEKESLANAAGLKLIKKINEAGKWEIPTEDPTKPGTLIPGKITGDIPSFIDLDFFKIDIINTILGKPDLFSYELLDKEHRFKFLPAKEFQNEKEARNHSYDVMALLPDAANYEVYQNSETGKYGVRVAAKDVIEAICVSEFDGPEEAAQMKDSIPGIIKQHQYFLTVLPIPSRWKFHYYLGYEKGQLYTFESEQEYASEADALTAANQFFNHVSNLQLQERKEGLFLVPTRATKVNASCRLAFADTDSAMRSKVKDAVTALLEEQKEIKGLASNPQHKHFSKSVRQDLLSQQGTWVYRLVDKNNVPAFFRTRYPDRQSAEDDIRRISDSYKAGGDFLQISLGGDITNERKEGLNAVWYHYHIKCLNRFYESGDDQGKELILFESAKGYSSKNEAELAFKDHYLEIIQLAFKTTSYGTDISLEKDLNKILVHDSNQNAKGECIVFVPEKTQAVFGDIPADIISGLIKIARSYPIRYLSEGSGQFNGMFTCRDEQQYYFQIKGIDLKDAAGKPLANNLVLFESTLGYPSVELAQTAYQEEFLRIKEAASQESGYASKIILQKPDSYSFDECPLTEKTVFVPKETFVALGNNRQSVLTRLYEIARGLPTKPSEFDQVFGYKEKKCSIEAKNDQLIESECGKKTEKKAYYFLLPAVPGLAGWQSIKFYDSAEEAAKAFDFFRLLLKYSGNYYTDCSCCIGNEPSYRIYIREVLAVSTERFENDIDAWGDDGLNRFICVAQSEGAFQTYQDDNYCYSFYVACKEALAVHPCRYDTPQTRDRALKQLCESLNQFRRDKSFEVDTDGQGFLFLLDIGGKRFAKVKEKEGNSCVSDGVVDFIEDFKQATDYSVDEGGYVHLKNKKGDEIASSYQPYTASKNGKTPIQIWKELLAEFVGYYPIVLASDKESGQSVYAIEIRLPDFNSRREYSDTPQPCGCGPGDSDTSFCSIAWKIHSSFDSYCEAVNALQDIYKILSNHDYYKPIYDCECGSYGIAIQHNEAPRYEETPLKDWDLGKMIAHNPQCYPSPDMACEAAERAKRLINSEGLDVVEHILLRPRCGNEYVCDWTNNERDCTDTNCEFEWTIPETGSCEDGKCIAFIPGTDPYSFIATVALPAWPARFRTIENRKLIEDILYREAPAHVMLRTLWLSPHDFCSFEEKFRNWTRWMANKSLCQDDFDICRFLDFLFNQKLECFDPECNACGADSDKAQIRTVNELPDFSNQITEQFCWAKNKCVESDDHSNDKLSGAGETPGSGVINPEAILLADKPVSSPKAPVEIDKEKKEPEPQNEKAKMQFINNRLKKYRAAVGKIVGESDHRAVGLADSFVKDPAPTIKRLSELVAAILEEKAAKAKGAATLSAARKQDLLQNILSYYIDQTGFSGDAGEPIAALKPITADLAKAGIDVSGIYSYWSAPEIKEYLGATREKEIQEIFSAS